MIDRPLVQGSNLWVSFGKESVLENFSFSISEGEHTVIKGRSGSGKSTLLKLILGFMRPSQGSITFRDAGDGSGIKRQTAWLPQDLDMGAGTVTEVIKMPFSFAANRSNLPDHAELVSVITQLGLSEKDLTKPFRSLSTGQRQRTGLAVCHLLDKSILMLDEPTSALDKNSKKKVRDLLLTPANKTVLSTSHDPFWLKTADNIIPLS